MLVFKQLFTFFKVCCSIKICSIMFGPIRSVLNLFRPIGNLWDLFRSLQVCSVLPIYVQICSFLLRSIITFCSDSFMIHSDLFKFSQTCILSRSDPFKTILILSSLFRNIRINSVKIKNVRILYKLITDEKEKKTKLVVSWPGVNVIKLLRP